MPTQPTKHTAAAAAAHRRHRLRGFFVETVFAVVVLIALQVSSQFVVHSSQQPHARMRGIVNYELRTKNCELNCHFVTAFISR